MKDYKKILEDLLKNNKSSRQINESVLYPEGIGERMNPALEDDLIKQKHSLGKHPIFPEGHESSFEEQIMGERFLDVAKRYKRTNDVDSIDNKVVMGELMPLVTETMGLENKHKKALEKLAIKMVREEYDMDEDIVEIHAELVPVISLVGTKKNPKPAPVNIQFKNHDEVKNANEEVYKRRFLNAMIQGAAKKCNHMFHMVDDELTDLDPRLPNKYAKMMAAADYMYYIIPEMENGVTGGVVKVQFPTESNPKAVIYVQAMVFPVLIHELVKGVMELLSAHGLPKNKKIGEFVINKADFLAAEPWDMRLGPALWERFTNLIDANDFHLKHHIYSELAALPVKEFNLKMREIMANTKEGKKIINGVIEEIKNGLKEDEFNQAMNEIAGDEENIETNNTEQVEDSFDFDELFGGSDETETNDDSFDYDELF